MIGDVADVQRVPVGRIFLDLDNPRHEPYQNEDEVIEYLCTTEHVYQLAKDIAKHGLNPLELFALIPRDGKMGKGKHQSYVAAEGNRRICAVMLLNDPDRAPAKLRKDFERLAEESVKITEVLAVTFKDKEQVGLWLDRIHAGEQGGVGRKSWNAEQIQRHTGVNKNALAQFVLDYAQGKGLISAEDRKGKLTTVQRYLGNKLLKDALGLDSSNPDDISITRPEQDFDIILARFIADLLNGTVNSRSNATVIEPYARSLSGMSGISGKRTEPVSLPSEPEGKAGKKKLKKPPKRPTKPDSLPYEQDIADALTAIPSFKLERIYWSLCTIHLEKHTPLLCVGVWLFFECLTALAGRKDDASFESFLNKQYLQMLGLGDGKNTKSLREAIERIAAYGNTTKHHKDLAHFNGTQLANDMHAVKELICKLAEKGKKPTP